MNPIIIYKELGFIYIVNGRKFLDYNKAKEYKEELYAKQESQAEKVRQKEKKESYQKI